MRINPLVASHGDMWIMLIHIIASAASIGSMTSEALIGSGVHRLPASAASPHAVMLSRFKGSGSLGCQRRSGNARAKYTLCSPDPLAISSTIPVAGR